MERMIRQERISRGWTQEQVANAANITPEALSMIEAGKRNPSYPVLVKLENLFGMTHRELFAAAPGEEKAQPDYIMTSKRNTTERQKKG